MRPAACFVRPAELLKHLFLCSRSLVGSWLLSSLNLRLITQHSADYANLLAGFTVLLTAIMSTLCLKYMSLHFLVKRITTIHRLFVTGILLRNLLFKQLRCELKISKSMDFYCFLNFFTPKLYRFSHKKTQIHALKICPTAPANAQRDLTDSLPSVVARAFSSDTSVTS